MQQGFKLIQIRPVFTACVPILSSKLCHWSTVKAVCGRTWKLRWVVWALKHRVVYTFLPFYTPRLLELLFHVLDLRKGGISRFEERSALDLSPFQQFSTSINVAHRQMPEWRATHMDELKFEMDLMQTVVPWETLCGKIKFFKSDSDEKVLRIGKDRTNLIRLSWPADCGDIRSELS